MRQAGLGKIEWISEMPKESKVEKKWVLNTHAKNATE
jgi:hypothetical protein